MIKDIRQVIKNNWAYFPLSEPISDKDPLFVTKFCQRIAGRNTKVLFLVTYKHKPLCIIKTVRDVSFNENLKHEKEAQERFPDTEVLSTPRVYFSGLISGRYMYAEEVILGNLVSKNTLHKKEREIIEAITSFPAQGSVSSEEILDIFSKYAPQEDTNIQNLIQCIRGKKVMLKKGFTHNDFARPNIINNYNKLYLIDWERSGEIPIWLIDAVYFIVRSKNIRDVKEWNKKGSPVIVEHTGINATTAEALYCILMIFWILRKKYPKIHSVVTKKLFYNI